MVHIVNKGKGGEREIVTILNSVLEEIITERESELNPEIVDKLRRIVQRNQNQSAVGGSDISIFGLAVEVKRQETLSVEAWWRQACASANTNKDVPVLIYRQNRKAWHVVMDGFLEIPKSLVALRVQIDLPDFLRWFKQWATERIQNGNIDRV